jgi:hypothetical protein
MSMVRRATPACLLLVIAFGTMSCSSGDGSVSSNASRSLSNLNARSLPTLGSEIPTMADANVVTRGALEAGAWHRTYDVAVAPAAVLAFYQRELPSTGWTADGITTAAPSGTETSWRRRGLRLDVTIAPSAAEPASTVPSGSSAQTTVNLSLRRAGA